MNNSTITTLRAELIDDFFKLKSIKKIPCYSSNDINIIICSIIDHCESNKSIFILCKNINDIILNNKIYSRLRYKNVEAKILYSDGSINDGILKNTNIKIKKINPLIDNDGNELSFVTNEDSGCVYLYNPEQNQSFLHAYNLSKKLVDIFIENFYAIDIEDQNND